MKPASRSAPRQPRSELTLTALEALSQSKPLARLGERLRESDARLAAIRPVLPATLAAQLRPGPLDDDGWSLLAANPGVAVKLRQLEPRLQQALAEAGFASVALRIRVRAAAS